MISISSALFGASIAAVFSFRFQSLIVHENGREATAKKLTELKNFIKLRRSLAVEHARSNGSTGTFPYWNQLKDDPDNLTYVIDEASLLVRRYMPEEFENFEFIISIEYDVIHDSFDASSSGCLPTRSDILREIGLMIDRATKGQSFKNSIASFLGLRRVVRPPTPSIRVHRIRPRNLQVRTGHIK